MSKLEDLNINSITNAKGIEIPFVIVFTFLDDYIDTFGNRTDRALKQFDKQFKTDKVRNGYYHIEDVELDTEDEPYKDKPTAIITKDSLSAISEKDKETLEFGIRVIDSSTNTAYIIDDEMKKYLKLDNINSGIPFDDVESTLNTIMEQVEHLNDAVTKQEETKREQDANRVEVEPQEPETINEDTEVFESDNQDVIDGSEDEEVEESPASIEENNENEISDEDEHKDEEAVSLRTYRTQNNDVSNVLSENKAHKLSFNDKQPETPLEFAQQDLLYEISKYFPEIKLPNINYIPDSTVKSMSDSDVYDNILSIKQLTEEKLGKRSESLENYLNNVKNDAILKVYNKLNRRLNVENDELMRKSDFTSEYSPFNENFTELKSQYQSVVNSLADTKHEEIKKNKQQHEMDKEAYVENAAKRAAQEFDRNNLHLIEGNAQKYIEEIKSEADEQYNTNYELLEKDSDNWYAQNFNTLVPKIVHSYKDEIESIGESVNNRVQESIEDLNKKMESDLDDFVNKVKDITAKEIETDQQNEELIQRRVHERTIEYTELKHKLENLQKDNDQLKRDNREEHEKAEQHRRDYLAEKMNNEALENTITNRQEDINNANDRYHQITQLIANGKIERLKELLDLDKVQPIKPSFTDKVKNWSNVIAAGVAALILSIALVIAAVIFGSGNAESEGQVSQSDVKSQVEQAVNDNNKKHETEQKQNQEEIDKLKEDLKKEQEKNKKDDKK